MSEQDIKNQVQDFYDRVGWQQVSEGVYQNAAYEDLRPVVRQYVHDCHLRVLRHLPPRGHLLLDAGSGPIQYPEYLEYSRGYQKRVCVDISMVALQEARKRIGEHGLFVVADIAHLPFKADVFDGLVSLHTIHHLPLDEHVGAYQEMQRVLHLAGRGVVVNGWDSAPLAVMQNWLVRQISRLRRQAAAPSDSRAPTGTFVRKHNAAWLKHEVGQRMPLEIWTWRSVSVYFLRTFIHARLGGRFLLSLLYQLEERFPHFFGKNGQYPLIVMRKAGRQAGS